MLGYEISIRCICGQETKYKLNALRFPIVTFGRKQDKNTPLPDINICAPDENKALSRYMLYFAYDQNEQDWVVGAGFPIEKYRSLNSKLDNCSQELKEDKSRNKKQDELFYFPKHKLFSILDKKYSNIGREPLICGQDFDNAFVKFTDKPIFLKDIAGIGIVPCDAEYPLVYKGENRTSIQHPLLGQLPFGWYIEVSANRTNNMIIRSFLTKSTIIAE